MKITLPPSFKNKNKTYYISIFLICSILLNSYASLNYSKTRVSFINPTATISASSLEICKNESSTITFEGSGGTEPYTFTYKLNDDDSIKITTTSGNSVSITLNGTTIGNYTYKLIEVKDNTETVQEITDQEITIKVNTPPTADFTFPNEDDNACSGETVKFKDNSTGIGQLTYNWDFGDTNTSTQRNPNHVFEALGCGTKTFNVKLTVTDNKGCSSSKTRTISVKEKPSFEIFDVSEKDFSKCGNTSSTDPNFEINVGLESDNASPCITNYNIKWGDGNEENTNSFPIAHNYVSLGVYDMVITASSSNGCSNIIRTTVKNISNPSGSIVNPGSTQNICAPTNAIPFVISSWGNNSLDTRYEINYGDGATLALLQTDLINTSYYNSADPVNSENYKIPHVYTKSSCPETYTASLNVINACGTTPSLLPNISILEKPKLAFSFSEKACVNTSVTFINNSIYGNGNNCDISGRFTWDFGDGTTTGSSTSLDSKTHSYSSPGKYIVKLSATSFCGEIEITKEICIEPKITTSFTADNLVGCIPFDLKTTNNTNQAELCSIPTYNWAVVYTSDNCGTFNDWVFTNGTDENSENAEFTFNTPGKYRLTQSTTTACGTETDIRIIDVKKPPTASIQEIDDACGNLTINPIADIENCTTNADSLTYNWTFTGGTPVNSTTLNPGSIEYNTPGPYTVTLEVSNECGVSNTASEEFEVFEIPSITNTNLTQEICSSQSTSEITLNSESPNTTYTWSAIASSGITGFTPNGNSNKIPAQILTNSENNSGTVTYTAAPTINGCTGDETEFIITVNPALVISKQPFSSEVCLNGTATLLEVASQNGTTAATYQWFSNIKDSTIDGTQITNATNDTYNPPTDTVGETFYYVEIYFATSVCSKIVSNTASVNVVPQITVNPVATPQTICVGGTANEFEVTYSGGTGNPSYQWFSNIINVNIGGTLISGATNSTYTPDAFSNAGDYYYYTEISLDGNGCNSASSDVFEVNVLPDPVIDEQPIANQELCQGAIPTDLTVSISGGTNSSTTYQWYQNTTNSISGGTVIQNTNSASYTPETVAPGTFYYYVIVSQSEAGCSVTSTVSELKVNEAPIVSKQPISSEICSGGTATLLEVVYQNGTGTASYQWFSNTTDSTISGTKITNETTDTFNPPTNTVGETFYYVEINFTSRGCSRIVSNTANVNIVSQISVNPVATPQTICVGGTANEFEVTYSGGTGNPSYQWFSNTNTTNSDGTLITGATNSTFTPNTFSTEGNYYYYTEISFDGNGCNSASSDVFEVNVLPDPVIDEQPIGNQELCQGAIPTDLTVTVSGGTNSVKNYQWYQNTTNSISGGTVIQNTNSASYTPETVAPGTFYYYVIVSQSEAGCSVTSTVSELKVNEAPIVSKQPISSEICSGGTATLLEVVYQNGTGTASYQWFSNTTDSTIDGTPISNEINSSYTPPTDTFGETFYYVEISFTTGGCSKIVSNIASVAINETPVISSAEITTYSKITFNFNPSSIAGNTIPTDTKYTWPVPTFNPANSINGASAETDSQDKISQTLENTGTTPVIVSYTITPATTKCVGEPFILEVTVNSSITSNAVITNNTCFESNDGSIVTNITGGTPFETDEPYLISWTGPNGFAANDETINNLQAGLYIVTIEDKEGFSITEELKITQPNILSISNDLEKNISCFQGNDGAIELTISGGTLPYTFNWSTSNGSGIIQNTESQNTLTAGTYTLEIIDKNKCTTTTSITLTEPEELIIENIFKQSVLCFGDATGTIEIDVSGGTPIEVSNGVFEYIYDWSGPEGFTSISKDINNLIAGTYTVTVTDSFGCTTTATIIISQSPEIELNYTKTDVTCYQETDGSIDVNVTGGAAPYQISWSNLANGFSLSNLSAGTYVATITDGNSCTKRVSIIIEEPIFFIDPVVTLISCNGKNDGAIDLNLTGGVPPFSLTWDDDINAGVQRNNLSPGSYRVVIVDSDTYQCPIEQVFILTNALEIAVSTTVVDALDCDIVNSGSINMNVFGGNAPFSFLWNTNETSEDLENLPPGDYSVEITDSNGCSLTKQFNIFRQEPIRITLEEITLINCDLKIERKQTEAKVTGGYLPYTYTWSAGTISGADNNIMTTDQNGSYTLTITDDKGCTESKSFIIDVPATIGNTDFRYSAFALNKYDLLSIEDPIQFTNISTGNYSKSTWDFGDGSPIVTDQNPIHIYDEVGTFTVILKVEYNAGCIEYIERTVNITKGYALINPNAFTPNGDGYNDVIRPSYRGFITLEMTIYDTWGTSVYYEKNINLNGWNGTINGLPAENGNYVMVIRGLTFYKKEILTSTPLTLLK
jgi:gliding motility-associated-like protein